MGAIDRIIVTGVTRLFGATAALKGISCEFAAGTTTFVQGPNGAGKSTLMAIIGTILRPTSGTVSYGRYGTNRSRARAHIGWVAHQSHCYPELTGLENVRLAAELYGVRDPTSVGQAIARVQAEGFASQPVGTLSRGQKQRVALARALVHRPSLLLLDEPLSGLDTASSTRCMEVVKEEQARGAIVIIVSHRDAWVAEFDARSLRLERGRLAQVAAKGRPA